MRRTLTLWSLASLASIAAVVGLALFGAGPGGQHPALTPLRVMAGIACLLPYIMLLGLLGKDNEPGPRALGFANGVGAFGSAAIIALALAATIGRLVLLATMRATPIAGTALGGVVIVTQWIFGLGAIALVMLAVFALTQLRLASAARAARALDTSNTGAAGWATGRTAGFASLAAVGALLVLTQTGEQPGESVARTESAPSRPTDTLAVVQALIRLQGCAAEYADSFPGRGYPGVLRDMGPGAGNCLDSALAAGASGGGYEVRYHPVRDSSGRVNSWWAIGRRPNVRLPEDTYMADQTGGVYRRLASADANPDRDMPDSNVRLQPAHASIISELLRPVGCIRGAYATVGANGGYPADLARVPRPKARQCLGDDRANSMGLSYPPYRLTYVPDSADSRGRIGGFTLQAEPLHYGEDAVRSYVIQPDSTVHYTLSRRPPNVHDPVLTGCEIDSRFNCRVSAGGGR